MVQSQHRQIVLVVGFFFLVVGLGFELGAMWLLKQALYYLSHASSLSS
jgi:hypothetical protein